MKRSSYLPLLGLLVILMTACQKEKASEYVGTYTGTRSGGNGTFSIIVRQNGSDLDFESTFGTWTDAVVLHGDFHRGTKKKGSTVDFTYQHITQGTIHGDGDLDDGDSFKLDITFDDYSGNSDSFQVTAD